MARDVVLDLVFATEIAKHYEAGCAALGEMLDEVTAARRAVVAKGLLSQYAAAMTARDVAGMRRVGAAMDLVSKDLETFRFRTGETRQVEVTRDRRGRFTRYLSSAESSIAPTSKAPHQKRAPGEVALADDVKVAEIRNAMAQAGPPGSTQEQERLRGRKSAGVIRAISSFQDELIDLFGEDSKDVRIIVEGSDRGDQPREATALGLTEPVSPEALRLGEEAGQPRMSVGVTADASPELAQRLAMIDQLMAAGFRQDVAAELAGAPGAGQAVANVGTALRGYRGAAPSTAKGKADRHFKTAAALGGYFAGSSAPQLQAAGAALKVVGEGGRQIPQDVYDSATKLGFRYRGLRDRLPEAYTEALGTPEHQALTQMFDNPNLTPATWARIRSEVLRPRAQAERELSMRRDATGAEFSDVSAGVLNHLESVASPRVSPRDYIDRYTADLAVASLIPEIPADRRAAELANKAGYGIPSSGIIIRADGAAKEMYRGVAEDHYLPFSAKALPELRDGQYVRTRVLGGFTPEDLRVALTGGARRATVVSGSGVFTLDLKPDVSATGRMTSPDISAMPERYERILDAVANSGMYAQDVPGDVRAKLMNEAMRFVGSPDPNDEAVKTRFESLMRKQRAADAELGTDEIEAIRTRITADAERIPGSTQNRARIVDDMLTEAIDEARAEKVRSLGLNSEGYALALDTLRLQYPSLIRRVSHENLNDWVKERELGGALRRETVTLRARRGARDTNLVKPGQTRANTPEWSGVKVQRLAREAEQARTAAATVAGAGGASGAAGAAPSAPAAPGGLNAVHTAMAEKTAEAQEQARLNATAPGFVFIPNPAPAPTDPWVDLTNANAYRAMLVPNGSAAAPPTGVVGASALRTDTQPYRVAGNVPAMKAMAKTPEGLTVGLELLRNPGPWNAGLDSSAGAGVDEARMGLDEVLSAELVASPRVGDSADIGASRQMFFAVPDDVASRLPATIETGKGADVLADVTKYGYDPVSRQGADRIAARDRINDTFAARELALSEQFGHNQANSLDDLSVFGLLAAQSATLNAVNLANSATTGIGRSLILAIDPGAYDRGANLDAAKVRAAQAYAGMYGTEYLRRVLGGGITGPKGSGVAVVAKASPPSPAVLYQLLAQHVAQLPPRPSPHLVDQ